MKTPKQIASEIYLSRADNGKADTAIEDGEKMIIEYANQRATDFATWLHALNFKKTNKMVEAKPKTWKQGYTLPEYTTSELLARFNKHNP